MAGRAEQLPFPDASFDALTFTYLLRYVRDPQATLAELARVLKPGGTMASLEFCVPAGPFWHPAWWAYTWMVLPAGGLLLGGREWFRVGRFLGPNISGHYRRYPIAWTVAAWEKAGLTDVGTRIMSLGGGLVMWGTRAASEVRRPGGFRRRALGAARVLRGPAGRVAGLVDAAASAVHGLAPVLRGHRRRARAAGAGQLPDRDRARVLPRGRAGRARAGRTERPPAADGDPVRRAGRRGRRRAAGCAGARRVRGDPGRLDADPVTWWRARCW